MKEINKPPRYIYMTLWPPCLKSVISHFLFDTLQARGFFLTPFREEGHNVIMSLGLLFKYAKEKLNAIMTEIMAEYRPRLKGNQRQRILRDQLLFILGNCVAEDALCQPANRGRRKRNNIPELFQVRIEFSGTNPP
ncbi:hypothetical protein KA005_01275 [bacterium]|nr:hypothetical protein [bacterium]